MFRAHLLDADMTLGGEIAGTFEDLEWPATKDQPEEMRVIGDDGTLLDVELEEPEIAVTAEGSVVLAEDLPVVVE